MHQVLAVLHRRNWRKVTKQQCLTLVLSHYERPYIQERCGMQKCSQLLLCQCKGSADFYGAVKPNKFGLGSFLSYQLEPQGRALRRKFSVQSASADSFLSMYFQIIREISLILSLGYWWFPWIPKVEQIQRKVYMWMVFCYIFLVIAVQWNSREN